MDNASSCRDYPDPPGRGQLSSVLQHRGAFSHAVDREIWAAQVKRLQKIEPHGQRMRKARAKLFAATNACLEGRE